MFTVDGIEHQFILFRQYGKSRRKMKGFRLKRGSAVAACVVLAVALGGRALSDTRITPHTAPVAEPVRLTGVKIFEKWCSDCHRTAEGPGSLALQRKYHDALPAVLELRNNLSPDYVKLVVRRGISFMPSFRKTEISDADLSLVAAYLAPSH
ncbi:c-type cytochrome [Hydrocarboniphaga sp.]|uniref:c-type cytochrome n=1 Tax=Hydrocarboniphaga sp. TaxID=2033016 RepID=UPI003D0CB0E2